MSVFTRSRAAVQSLFKLPGGLPSTRGAFAVDYRLDSSTVDLKLARALYNNTEVRYKLGAGFARPAINVPVGFMGIPIMKANTQSAQEVFDALYPDWTGNILKIHRALMRDGEVLARLYPANRSPAYAKVLSGDEESKVDLSYAVAGSFDIETVETDILAIEAFRIKHIIIVRDGDHRIEKALYETVRADTITYEWEDNFRPTQTMQNPLGFVPAVYMKNDGEDFEMHGRSELEPLEPYLKFYNDVMLHAGAASKLHSTAKLILRVRDVETFLTNNFTDAEIQDGRLRFKDKDVLFFESGMPEINVGGGQMFQEGADVVQARAPLGDTNTLLEYIFLNIVDVSEVPEWAFGGAIASSKASVTEQSAPLIHKVKRKRSAVENDWAMLGRMALAMVGVSSSVSTSWDELAQRDLKAEAEALKAMSEALTNLNDAEIISKIAAVEHLQPLIPSLLEYIVDGDDEDEKSRIKDEKQENDARAAQLVAQLNVSEEDDDRQAGLRAIG